MSDIKPIESAAARLRGLLDETNTVLADLATEVSAAEQARLPRLRRLADEITRAQLDLRAMLDANQAAVLAAAGGKNKTVILHRLRLGWRKQKDKWTWPAADTLVALVRAALPDLAPSVIDTVETVRTDALSPDQRRAVGATLTEGKDAIVIEEIETGAAKALAALLKRTEDAA